jgi:quercetin dioxygenase-like cupin family protein
VKRVISSLVVITGISVFALHLTNERAAGQGGRTSQAASQIGGSTAMSPGLILAAGEGERLIRRQYGFPLIIKVDPTNGGSKHMVVGTEEIPAGKSIPVHKHSHADEFIVLQEGTASVTLGARRQTANAGAMIFIPENEWVGLENVGPGTMKILFVFSAVGFEQYLRATSVPEGKEVKPFSPDELKEIRQKYQAHIAFKDQ